MIPLIIDDKVRDEIERVKKNAEQYPVLFETLKKIKKGEAAPGGDDSRFSLHVPAAFRVVYTHEEQPGKIVCRHLSMSLQASGRVPNPLAVEMMLKEFGFVNNKIKDMIWWQEKIGEEPNSLTAINVIEPLDGNYGSLKKK